MSSAGDLRDIDELDGLSHEVRVCLDKSANYFDTAKRRLAPALAALEAGEFGEQWDGRKQLGREVIWPKTGARACGCGNNNVEVCWLDGEPRFADGNEP